MRDDKNTRCSGESRRSHRAYRDPTADTAIANVMREERKKKKQQEKYEKRPGKDHIQKRPGTDASCLKGGGGRVWK